MSNASHNANLFSAFQENGLVSDKTLDRFDRWAKADEAFCALIEALENAGADASLIGKIEEHYGAVLAHVEDARQDCQEEADGDKDDWRGDDLGRESELRGSER